jgi:arabinose-5-phosphate isomerase
MSNLRDYAKEVIKTEAEAVAAMADKLDDSFNEAVEAILKCKGRVIVAGMGKSGLIGKKIVATFNSTGISSFFLHPAEAMHGDLGLMREDDILMLISKSGRLGEMEMLISTARRLGVPLIALCGTIDSDLYKRANMPLNCSVEREACPNNLVPTSSSTAALVMGDALAVALLNSREFSKDDFAVLHPGGSLGMRLLKKVSELHHVGKSVPIVKSDATMKEMIVEMTSKKLGCVVTVDSNGKLAGIFTDGDLRRMTEHQEEFFKLTADEVMIKQPKFIESKAVLDRALAIMEKYSITQLPTVDDEGLFEGIIHLHDILRSKLV